MSTFADIKPLWMPFTASLIGWCVMRVLSSQFSWDIDFEQRPILIAVTVLVMQWAALFWAHFEARKLKNSAHKRATIMIIIVGGCLFHFIFIGSTPIQENDANRYLWDGAVSSQGVSPYKYTPSQVNSFSSGRNPDYELAKLQQFVVEDKSAQTHLDRVSYKEVHTIYPPTAQLLFYIAYKATGWSWDGLRFLFISAYFGGVLLTLTAQAELMGYGTATIQSAIFLGWNPLAVKEIANCAHLDAVLVLWFGAIVYLFKYRNSILYSLIIGALAGLAILTKIYPLLIIPVIIAASLRISIQKAICIAISTTAVVVVWYGSYLVDDGAVVFSGFNEFTSTWLRNAGLFSLINDALLYVWGSEYMSLPLVPGGKGPTGTVAAKILVLLIVLGVVFAQAFRDWKLSLNDYTSFAHSSMLILMAWFLLLPMAYPWYLLGLISFAAPSRVGICFWVLAASIHCGYNLLFYSEYHNCPIYVDKIIVIIEYSVPFGYFFLSKRNQAGGSL